MLTKVNTLVKGDMLSSNILGMGDVFLKSYK